MGWVQRKLLILTMLKWIRKKLMKRLINKRQKEMAWGSEILMRIYDNMIRHLQIRTENPINRANE